MVLNPHLLSCFYLLLFLPITIITLASSTLFHPRDHYLINCGGPTSFDGGGWRSDKDPPFAPSPASATTTTTTTVASIGTTLAPYNSGRVFWGPLRYSFPLSSPGPILLRLYFSATTSPYNNIDLAQFFLSLTANGFELLRDFSPYLVAQASNPRDSEGHLVREFYITLVEEVDNRPFLNLTFSPSDNSSPSYGFVNGIEVISVPDGLYVPTTSTSIHNISSPYFIGGQVSDFNFPESIAMEAMIRVNVGGSDVPPSDDSGLCRTWYNDVHFIGEFEGNIPFHYPVKGINYTKSTPAYTAPERVYGTMRIMGPDHKVNRKTNLTWVFEVDASFDYLVRLHFCELFTNVTQSGQLQFHIYINGQMAPSAFDLFDSTGGLGIPTYEDFVVYVDDNGNNKTNGSRVHLSVALHPSDSLLYTAVLNGLEIFKLNISNGSLAAPNPRLSITTTPNANIPAKGSNHHLVLIIIGASLGFILLSLAAFVFLFIRRAKEKKAGISTEITASKDPTKTKWGPINVDEYNSHSSTATGATSSSVASSLPSNLCRRFSLTQIRVATCDFDESAIIGSGGFGKVYKGSIDGGPTLVAVKRLNPTSTQGAHEFRNEIEMLSMLRHMHLVSLIGYCEDHGEMILVYEYMSRGTLRDHLMYKGSNSRANNNMIPLSWKQRLAICVGSARGLHYLHTGAKQPIIHRDVKSTNILLDDKWAAKVSDFGLSKVGPAAGDVSHVSTAVKGSVGYLDPEYFRTRQLTQKSDVYSFGVVLFEVLCARKAINPTLPKEEVNLAVWARNYCKSGTLESIVDPNLAGQIAPESLRKFGEVAEMCVRDHGSERPSMEDVVWGLEFALQLQLTADHQKNDSGIDRAGGGGGGGGDHVTTDEEVFTALGDNFTSSRSTPGGSGTIRSFTGGVDDQSTRSSSVFSEILHPQGR